MSWFRKEVSSTQDVVEETASPPTEVPTDRLSEEATHLVHEALQIVDRHIVFTGASFTVTGTGSDGEVMEAAVYLEKAHQARPDSAELHYAYAAALSLAMQFKTARDAMEALNAARPGFAPARWALAGWDEWRSPLTLPELTPEATVLPPGLSEGIIGCTLRPVRDGIIPRAALFFRDRGDDFQDLAALRSARIDITTVVDAESSDIPVAGIYAQVWDDPLNSLGMEAHELPLSAYGTQSRMACQFLTTQRDIDFVVLGTDDAVKLHRRMDMPERMRAANEGLAALLDRPESHPYQRDDVIRAVKAHQLNYSATTVAY